MKRTFGILLFTATAIWIWVAWQLVGQFVQGPSRSESRQAAISMPFQLTTFMKQSEAWPADSLLGKNPFTSALYSEKPASLKLKPIDRTTLPSKIVVEPPNIRIEGFMQGAGLMALLRSGEATEWAKVGDDVFGVRVVKVLTNRVVVRKQGREFTLSYP